ncbi:hypothetical protein [Sulfurimonas sp.]
MLVKISLSLLLLQQLLFGFEYVLITNKHANIDTVSTKQVKDIFMIKKHFLNGLKIVPVNMPSSSKIRKDFEKKVLHVNRHKLNHYWIKQHFQGIRPPTVQSSVQATKLFVKNVTGAIAYIPASELDSDLKVIYEF